MKFRVTMKDPDGCYYSFKEAAMISVNESGIEDGDEREALTESRLEKIKKACEKWFRYDEYLTVEVDTDAKTCVVIEE